MVANVENFPVGLIESVKLVKRNKGNQGGRTKRNIKNIISAFDIEVTNLLKYNGKPFEHGIMYSWAFQLGLGNTIIGRTWDEVKKLFSAITNELEENETIIVFVHNLSYEFQFLRSIYHFKPEEVFALKSRKILKCSMFDGKIEFRCSYLQTNMNLEQLTKRMGVEHQKLSGEEFDYSKIRFPWTNMTESEWKYQINDVRGLVEAMTKSMELQGDTLYTLPLTSTGYVRRDAKAAMRYVGRGYIADQFPDYELYKVLKKAFRGGNTHANRYYTGMILEDVKSVDIASSYPSRQCNCKFPVTKFFHVQDKIDLNELIRLIDVRKKAVLCTIRFYNIRLIDETWGFPYISKSKCDLIEKRVTDGYRYDNGRVLEAKTLETTLTDIDLKIVLSEYTFDHAEVIDCWHARYGFLPSSLIKTTTDYFKAKTELKGLTSDDGSIEYQYARAKAKLDSVYGMMAQSPCKDNILFMEGTDELFKFEGQPEEEILLKQFNKAFLVYQWGVWVTAHARYSLEMGLRAAGENAVYCDTDSVKYVEEVDFSDYNNFQRQLSAISGAVAENKHGDKYYMGVFETEEPYKRFITWGAKKYAYEDEQGRLGITIAGVGKKHGAKFLAEHGGLEALKPGFIFTGEAGGLEAVYNDNADFEIEIEGHTLHIGTNVCLCPSTYKLGLTSEYENLIRYSQDGLINPI